MPDIKITKNFFEYGSVKYFRGNAESVELGAYGEKDDPIGAKAALVVADLVARDKLKGRVRHTPPVAIDWAAVAKSEVDTSGSLKYFAASASGTASFSYEKARSAKLKLMKLMIDESPLRAMLNTEADGARRYLAREGGDGRIVSTIWVALEGRIADSFSAAAGSGGSLTASLTKALELQVTANHTGSVSSESTIVLGRNTTFAYLMHRVTKWNKDKTRIEELDEDEKGLN